MKDAFSFVIPLTAGDNHYLPFDSRIVLAILGFITLICCVILLIENLKKYKASKPAEKKEEKAADTSDLKSKVLGFVKLYAPIFFCIFGILCLEFLGLIPMAFLIIFGWMKLMNNFSWAKSAIFAATVTVVIYLIFDMWLQIPFPGLI